MASSSLADRLIVPLRRLAAARDPRPPSDGQLLTAFVHHRDPDAFESLVRRHGPMVLGVCRRVIRHAQTAEDAFQAVFVVLARRAGAVKPREQVGNFLYGVAYRTALKAKGHLARRRTREKQVDAMPEPATPPTVWDDVQPVIDEELAALPDKLRLPVVLCDLEGRPQRDVAKHLGLPTTTLTNRLAAARRRLAERLASRGVTLAGGVLATVLTANAARAVSTPLVQAAAGLGLSAVGSGSGVVPANILELSEGVIRMLAVSKLKLKMTATLAAFTLLAGAGAGFVKADEPALVKPTGAKIRPDLNDKEYLKRVCESLRGSPATPAEIGYFVADLDGAKRKKVVTWLTEEPQADVVLLLEAANVVTDLQLITPTVTTVPKLDVVYDLAVTNPIPARTFQFQEKTSESVWGQVHDGVTFVEQPAQVWTTKLDNVAASSESDDAFLTRVIEAARGSKPTRLEKEYFIADKDAKKREKLLDLILSDPALAKKLGPNWKQTMLNPPQQLAVAFHIMTDTPWATKLIDELLAAKKTDDQTLEALTLAATGRLPTDTEKKLAAAMVAKQKDKKAAWTEVAGTLGSTDEAKKHAERLKPNRNFLVERDMPLKLQWQIEPMKTKPEMPMK